MLTFTRRSGALAGSLQRSARGEPAFQDAKAVTVQCMGDCGPNALQLRMLCVGGCFFVIDIFFLSNKRKLQRPLTVREFIVCLLREE